MKTIRTLAMLLVVAVAGNNAMAQQALTLTPDKAYIFTGTAAVGSDTIITYQWYRNGQPIAGATSQSYTLPAGNANGIGVEFKRGTISSRCPGDVSFSNIYYVTFCGAIVGITCWAPANAASGNTFASRQDEYTPYFKWNIATAWAVVGNIDMNEWQSNSDLSSTWSVNPCPSGWRLPTRAEFQSLYSSGSTWADVNTGRGNAVPGRFYGSDHNNVAGKCTLPNNMVNCIFLPAVGRRYHGGGFLDYQEEHGYYWSATQFIEANGYNLFFDNSSSLLENSEKESAFSVRCVR